MIDTDVDIQQIAESLYYDLMMRVKYNVDGECKPEKICML
jgi:hypothetical protein